MSSKSIEEIFGIHAAKAALKNPRRKIYSLICTQDFYDMHSHDLKNKNIGKKWCPVRYKTQESSDLDKKGSKDDMLSPVKENEKETGCLHSEERAEVPHSGER